ncbi:MarR family transcriptional regulator [Altericroceibacterium spongiae]|uniref:MarR family transcriptional regulator n=1 Tax=Altericroceibacterium spongiae TaxID=2320269 RepID=A0A420EC82_9SPHN|nr:winged helix DNA-binding protein [Altericroceibacterium spongiae]RKF18285.1 MarR family transcriptional regulator [Altericroceibacterium spongiae]
MAATKGEPNFDEWALNFNRFYEAGSRAENEFRLTHQLVMTARRWTALVDDVVRDFAGQSRARWQTLAAIVFSDGPVATLDLSHRMAVQWPTLIRTLNELEADGLVKRDVNPADRRSRLISPTDKGVRLFEQAQKVLDPRRAEVLSDFTKEELVIGEKLLNKLFERISSPPPHSKNFATSK